MARGHAVRVAEAVRAACIMAAVRAYEEGGVSGLCAEGRWELAIEAIRDLDLERLLALVERRRREGAAPPSAAGGRAR